MLAYRLREKPPTSARLKPNSEVPIAVNSEQAPTSRMRFSLGSLGCFVAILCFFLAMGSYWLWPWTTTVRAHLPASEVPLILPEGAQDVSYAIHPSGEFRLEFDVNEPELIDWIKSGIGPTLEEDKSPYIRELLKPTRIGRFWALSSFSRGDKWATIQEGFEYLYHTIEEGTILF